MEEASSTNEELLRREVHDFIVENFLFGDLTQEIGVNDSFMDIGIINSTGILELIEFIEETYKIDVEDNELIPENLDSLSKISTYINSKQILFKLDQL